MQGCAAGTKPPIRAITIFVRCLIKMSLFMNSLLQFISLDLDFNFIGQWKKKYWTEIRYHLVSNRKWSPTAVTRMLGTQDEIKKGPGCFYRENSRRSYINLLARKLTELFVLFWVAKQQKETCIKPWQSSVFSFAFTNTVGEMAAKMDVFHLCTWGGTEKVDSEVTFFVFFSEPPQIPTRSCITQMLLSHAR